MLNTEVESHAVNYLNHFQETLDSENFKAEFTKLVKLETMAGEFNHAGHLLHLMPDIPVIGNTISGLTDYAMDYDEFRLNKALESQRKKIADIVNTQLETMQNNTELANWQQAMGFESFLHSIDSYYFTDDERDKFNQRQHQARISVMNLVTEDNKAQVHAVIEQQNKVNQQLSAIKDDTTKLQISYQEGYNNLQITLSEQHTRNTKNADEIKQTLKGMGVTIDDNLNQLIDQNDTVRNELINLCNFIESQEQKQQEQIAYQQSLMKHQTVSQMFGFVHAIGQHTQNNTLCQIAVVGEAANQVSVAVEAIKMIGTFSLSMVGAALPAAMAILSVFAAFKKPSPDINQIIVSMLNKIHQEIGELKKVIYDNHIQLLTVVTEGFNRVFNQFSRLHYSLTIPVKAQLAQIDNKLGFIFNILREQHQQTFQTKLDKIEAKVDAYIKKRAPITELTPANYTEKCTLLANFATNIACNSSLNGNMLFTLIMKEAEENRYKLFYDIFNNAKNDLIQLANLSDFLCSYIAAISEKIQTQQILINPLIWSNAIDNYVSFRQLVFSGENNQMIFNYDLEGEEILTLIQKGELFLAWLFQIKVPTLFQAMVNQYINTIEKFKNLIVNVENNINYEIVTRYAIKELTLSANVLIVAQNHYATKPEHYQLEYCTSGGGGKFKDRFKAAPQQNCFDALKIDVFPPILILAAKMGLGEFKIKIHANMSNGARQSWHCVDKKNGADVSFRFFSDNLTIQLAQGTRSEMTWCSTTDKERDKVLRSSRQRQLAGIQTLTTIVAIDENKLNTIIARVSEPLSQYRQNYAIQVTEQFKNHVFILQLDEIRAAIEAIATFLGVAKIVITQCKTIFNFNLLESFAKCNGNTLFSTQLQNESENIKNKKSDILQSMANSTAELSLFGKMVIGRLFKLEQLSTQLKSLKEPVSTHNLVGFSNWRIAASHDQEEAEYKATKNLCK